MPGAKKLPALPLYGGDWFKDVRLRQCSAATRGIYIDCLLLMWADDRTGRLEGTFESLARATSCTAAEFEAACIELRDTGAADVTLSHTKVTLENRRMRREYRKRVSARERKRNSRQGSLGLDDVTRESRPLLSSSVSTHGGSEHESPPGSGQLSPHEERRIAAYRGDYGSASEARRHGRRGAPISETERADRDIVEHVERRSRGEREPGT